MKKLLLILLCLPMIGFGQCKSGDCKNGYGIYLNYEELNDKYAGEWKGGKMNGQGTYTYTNGDKYVGEFKDNQRHGQGIYTFANGNRDKGEWKGGKMNGQGVKTWPSGEKAVGEFMEDKPLNVTLYDKEGKIKKKWGKGRDLFYNK
jgi:hypothetical protein